MQPMKMDFSLKCLILSLSNYYLCELAGMVVRCSYSEHRIFIYNLLFKFSGRDGWRAKAAWVLSDSGCKGS
jgi:hypothetical protein